MIVYLYNYIQTIAITFKFDFLIYRITHYLNHNKITQLLLSLGA